MNGVHPTNPREERPVVQAVLFDLDGVLRIWDRRADARIERETGLPAGAIRRAAFAADLLLPAITGRVPDERWREAIVERLRSDYPAVDAARAIGAWSEPAGTIDQAVAGLVRACRARAKVALVTNASTRLRADLRRLDVLDAFDCIVNSAEVGHVKPHREIYDAALRLTGAPAERAFFVDDTPEHMDGARAIGIRAHHYAGVAGLRDELTRLGLVPPIDPAPERR